MKTMEDLLANENMLDLRPDDETKSHISGIAQWANINAVIALVNLLLSVITTIYVVGRSRSYMGGDKAGAEIFKLVVTVAISLLLNINLLAAAGNLKLGVQSTDQGFFIQGVRKLATYFKILGILLIIGLVIVILVIVVAMLFSASRGSF